jgi:DNA-binding transcriptional LysR family regulator
MSMNPEWLRYYVVLAETRNFHKAAERLHITPQALSKAIAGLEAQLHVTLVERGRRVEGLTAAGEALLDEANTVLASLENAERRIAEWRQGLPQGPVTIAGDSLWHHYLLPPLLVDLIGEHPLVRPQLFEMIPDDVETWVAGGDVDIGLLLRPPRRTDLDWFAGVASPYVIAGKPGPQRPWQECRYIVPRLFRRELPESLDGWPEGKYKRTIVAEVELLETAIHLVEAGLGEAFLPELAIRDRVRQGSLAVVADAPCTFADQLYVVWRKGLRPSLAMAAVLDRLKGAGQEV